MKNKLIIMVLFIGVLFMGCAKSNSNTETQLDNPNSLKVYVSNYPLYDFTKNIAGDKVEVINIRNNSGIHGWEPSAKDIVNLANSDIFFYSGDEVESWATSIISNDSIKGKIVNVSEGLDLLASNHDGHNHDDDHDEDEDEHDDELDDHDEHEHDHGDMDPHIWLSLRNAKVIATNIANGLIEIDSENKEIYKENLDNYIDKLEELDKEYTEKLSNKKRSSIIVSHEAYGYLCRDYGFEQVGIEGVLAEGEPSVAQIDNIIKISKELGAKTIFYEETISPKVAKLIAEEVGADLVLLSPLEKLSPEQEAEGEDYLSIMKMNLEGIYKALNE